MNEQGKRRMVLNLIAAAERLGVTPEELVNTLDEVLYNSVEDSINRTRLNELSLGLSVAAMITK